MNDTEIDTLIDKLLSNTATKTILILLVKWGELTFDHLVMLSNIAPRSLEESLIKLQAYEFGQKDKKLNLITFKFFPYSSKRLYAATQKTIKLLGFTKNKKDSRINVLGVKEPRVVKVGIFATHFNFYELDHTTLCIQKLKELVGEKQQVKYYQKDNTGNTIELTKDVIKINHEHYFTGRELGYKWKPLFPQIKKIWNPMYKQVEERKPDLLIVKDPSKRIAVEIEHTKKPHARMKIVLKSLFALGTYMKQFEQLIIYANDKNIIYSNWVNLVKKTPPGYRPRDTIVLPLFNINKTIDKEKSRLK